MNIFQWSVYKVSNSSTSQDSQSLANSSEDIKNSANSFVVAKEFQKLLYNLKNFKILKHIYYASSVP